MPVSPPSEKEKPVRTVIGAAARGEHSNGIHCDPEPPIMRAECSKWSGQTPRNGLIRVAIDRKMLSGTIFVKHAIRPFSLTRA
jgi:hypothetical protein